MKYRDFTLSIYRRLLETLLDSGFIFQTFAAFLEAEAPKVAVLRHDVDKRPGFALAMAKLEAKLGISASYYFRVVEESYDETIMKEIAELGHEIGYHYEDLALAGGDMERALQSFPLHLERFRKVFPVKTICMHGSPLSRWDNRLLWKSCDYRDFAVMGEPYYDIDFAKVLYLTDTGRRWDGQRMNVRDKAAGQRTLPVRSTFEIIELASAGSLPGQIMINAHPQRWSDSPVAWLKELVLQNIKNIVKRIVARRRS
jgi:hypothetical protein